MSSHELSPRVEPSLPPPIDELDWQKFERLTIDVFGLEPDIATSEGYGVGGQSDYGVDVLARRRGGDGAEAASCKRRATIKPADLVTWSDDVLRHWDGHWRVHDLRRFVLATTATNTDARAVQDQVTRERARFAPLGVAFELWGPRQFAAKLKPDRALATIYLGDGWARLLCGPPVEPAPGPAAHAELLVAGAVAQLDALREALSTQAVARVDAALDALRSGDRGAVRALVDELRGAATWATLSSAAQARVLRLAASLALRDREVGRARELAAAADALAPADEPRMAAHIALEAEGVEAALAVLGSPITVAGRQLQAALLVMAGRVGEAEALIPALLAQSGQDPETLRTAALAALAAGDRALALERIGAAEALAPRWTAVRQLGAIVRFAAALSPAVPPEWALSPVAFDRALVREDRAARRSLAQALALFDALVEAEPDVEHHRVFRFAVLTASRDGRDRAEAEARDLLARTDAHPTVVALCLIRGVDVDLAEAEARLAEAYAAGADTMRVRALGMLLRARGADAEGRALLAAGISAQDEAAGAEAARWLGRLGDEAVAVALDPGDDPLAARLDAARAAEDWDELGAILGELAQAHPPEPLVLVVAEMLAGGGAWNTLGPHIDLLLGFSTAAAVRLAIVVALRTDDAARALAIIDAHADAFGEALPADVRRLRAEALAARGELGQALREAEGVAAAGGPRDRMLRAELRATAGDLRGTIPALREALDAGLLDGDRAFQWSRLIRHEEPRLARDLLGRALGGDLDDRLIVAAMHDAMAHAPETDIAPLMGRVQARAMSDAPDIRLFTIDELPALIAEQQAGAETNEALYLDGAIPAHLYYGYAPATFARLYAGAPAGPDAALPAWPIRHGARGAAVAYPAGYDNWRLHLDISALLVADRLGLLDTLEAHPNGLRLSARVPLLLVDMENALRGDAGTAMLDRIDAAGIALAGVGDERAVTVSTDTTSGGLSLHALAAALAARGALNVAAAGRLIAGLRDAASAVPAEDNVVAPPDGTPLRLDAVALRHLAAADLLAAVAARHPLFAPGTALDQVAVARRDAETAGAVADRLAAVRVRVATGIETGAYRLLAPSAPEADEDEDPPLVAAYRDLIAAPGDPNDMAWIDDRMTTGYANTAAMPVIGVGDVLAAMKVAGRLSTDAADRAAAELRRGGALFMPPTTEAVVAALAAAAVVDDRVVETPPLRDLRRAIAHQGRHERRLKIGDPIAETAAPLDEIAPVQVTMRLMGDALAALWTDARQSMAERIARADWLWANTRATHVGRRIPGPDPAAAQDLFETMQIGHCLDQAVEVGGLRDERRLERINYLGWLWQRAIEPMLRVDPAFLARLGRYLADFYAGLLEGELARDSQQARIITALVARRIRALPEPVQGQLFRDPRLAMFGTTEERITIGRVQIDPARFWRAVRSAGRYGEAGLRISRGGRGRTRRVRVRRDGSGVLLTGAVRARIDDEIVAIVIARSAARPAAIAAFLDALGLDAQAAARAHEAARVAANDVALVAALRDARDGSAAARYADIEGRLLRRERFRLDLLTPPPFKAIAAALALPADAADLAPALAAARRALAESAGPAHAFRALAGIPVAQDWDEGVDAAAVAAREARARTPLALIHAAAAARRRGAPAEEVAALVERLLAATLDAGSLFVSLLRWTWRLAARDPEWRAAPPAIGLALVWAHADRVLAALLDGRIERGKLLEMVEGSQPDLAGVDILRFVSAASGDAAWPAGLSPAALLYHGLGHIFGEEDASAALCAALSERLTAAMSGSFGGVTGPEVKLLGRDPAGPDVMGSFLRATPRGLLDGDASPAALRAQLVAGALAALVADPEDAGAWAQFGGFAAAAGIDVEEVGQVEAALGEHGVRLARLAAGGDYAIWRAALGPIAAREPDRAAAHSVTLARACRWLEDMVPHAGAFRLDRGMAASELVELAALIAARTPGGEADRFASLVEQIAATWPAIAADLRAVADGITTRTPSGRADALWRMHLALRAMP